MWHLGTRRIPELMEKYCYHMPAKQGEKPRETCSEGRKRRGRGELREPGTKFWGPTERVTRGEEV